MKIIKKWKDLDRSQIVIGEDNEMYCYNISFSLWKDIEGFVVEPVGRSKGVYRWTDGITTVYFLEEHLEDRP